MNKSQQVTGGLAIVGRQLLQFDTCCLPTIAKPWTLYATNSTLSNLEAIPTIGTFEEIL